MALSARKVMAHGEASASSSYTGGGSMVARDAAGRRWVRWCSRTSTRRWRRSAHRRAEAGALTHVLHARPLLCHTSSPAHHHHGHGSGNNNHDHDHDKQQRKIPSVPPSVEELHQHLAIAESQDPVGALFRLCGVLISGKVLEGFALGGLPW